MTKIYTIVVTYNGAPWIERCIEQLLDSHYPTHITVVDNCSTDNTVQLLKRYQAAIKVIRSDKNLGFGGGNNIGIQYALEAGADFLFLLNQDAYVEKNCIGRLKDTLVKYNAYGIISPLQLNNTGLQLDHKFKKYLSPCMAEGKIQRLATERPDEVLAVRFVNAAAWMMPAAAVCKVGLFHPVFTHYGEDNHYCSRMQYHGYRTGIDCAATLIHDRGNESSDTKRNFLKQLRTVPLYTLLDIRKPFFLAFVLGYQKLKRIRKKMGLDFTGEAKLLYEEQARWFRKNLGRAKQIRNETKKNACVRK